MVPDHHPPDPQTLAEQMAPVALEYAERVRTDPPMLLWRELVAPYDGWHQAALVALLAAAVDPSVHPDVLWGWARHRDVLEHPSPIVWPDGQVPIEELDSEAVTALILRRQEAGWKGWQIAAELGVAVTTVESRLRDARRRAARVEAA